MITVKLTTNTGTTWTTEINQNFKGARDYFLEEEDDMQRVVKIEIEEVKMTMNARSVRNLWHESGKWKGKHFVQLFGETRGMDLWRKFDADNVLGFLSIKCNDEEIEALLNFRRI